MSEPVQQERFTQGMKIACPEGWSDKSMLILNSDQPGPSGVSPNIVVTRETATDDLPVDGPARLEAFVERQLEQMAIALADFVVVDRIHATAEQWSAELKIQWQSDGTPLMQWITYANADDTALIIATVTAGRDDFATAEPQFQAILKTVRLS